jgi:hypothetical protein
MLRRVDEEQTLGYGDMLGLERIVLNSAGLVARVAIASLLIVTACGKNPAPTQVAAFVMDVRTVPCPQGVEATRCFDLRIRNIGGAEGSGSCRLWGDLKNGSSVPGEILTFDNIAPGKSLTHSGVWKDKPTDFYRGLCNPGPRL